MIDLLILAVVAFIQNSAFTWVSRSRNSGDVRWHRLAAYCSNAIWFVTHILIWKQVWAALTGGDYWVLAATGLVYVVFTTEGSCWAMSKLIKIESGKRRVGA